MWPQDPRFEPDPHLPPEENDDPVITESCGCVFDTFQDIYIHLCEADRKEVFDDEQ